MQERGCLYSLTRFRKEKDEAAQAAASGNPGKQTAAELRVQKDHNELSLPQGCQLEFDDVDDLVNFKLKLTPSEGLFSGATFLFTFKVGVNYPHEAPKVMCKTKIYHPNIDLDGNICLNILREDWKPVLNLQSVILGLVYLFLEPNPDDPLNKEAALVMKENRAQFEKSSSKKVTRDVVLPLEIFVSVEYLVSPSAACC